MNLNFKRKKSYQNQRINQRQSYPTYQNYQNQVNQPQQVYQQVQQNTVYQGNDQKRLLLTINPGDY